MRQPNTDGNSDGNCNSYGNTYSYGDTYCYGNTYCYCDGNGYRHSYSNSNGDRTAAAYTHATASSDAGAACEQLL